MRHCLIGKEYWDLMEKTAAKVEKWPKWKLGETSERLDIMKKTTVKKTIRQRFIIDASGSMGPQMMSVINGFNEQLEQMQREQKEKDVRYLLSLTQFSYRSNLVYKDLPLYKVPKLSTLNYSPNGGTALLDAIGENLTDGGNYDCLVTIMTDGEENSSTKWTLDQTKP